MVSRAMWKGQLRLSLVSIPVELFSATKSGGRTSFRQIHKPTGKPIHYEKIVEGVGAVKEDDIVKGYELDDGKYVLLQPKEIDAVKRETKKTLELVQFVGADEISPGERRAATGGNVVDLMAALKKSLEGSGGPAKRSKPAASRRPKSA